MSQICAMLKTPGNYVEFGFSGEICRPFLAHFRSSLPEDLTWSASGVEGRN